MSIQDDLAKAQAALRDPNVKSYRYKNKTYTLTQLRDVLIPQLQKEIQSQKTAEQEAQAAIIQGDAAVRAAQKRLEEAQSILLQDRRAFAKNNLSEAKLAVSEQRVADAQRNLDALLGVGTVTTAPVSRTNVPGPTVRVGGRTATPTVTATPQEEPVTETPVDEPVVTTPTTTSKGKGKGRGKKAAAPAGTGPMGLTAEVRAEFAKQFPEFAASLDGGAGEQAFVDFFGKDLIDLWVRVATTDEYDLDSKEGLAVYLRDVENTAYGQRTNQAQQDFDLNPKNQSVLIKAKRDEITKSYADLQLTDAQLNEVARDAARNGYTGDDLRFSLYNYAYRGALPTATESALADEIRNIGRSYGYTVSQDKLKAALTGTPFNGRMVTKESLLQEAQTAAKGAYGHLADQIDSGLTLDDIFYNYKMFAARTLGVDPNTIDYTKDTKWSEAFGTKETGQMSLNDWVTKLKRDGRYGYQYSPQAQEEVASVVSTLEKAFGFRK